jgi:hypothetical protein
MPSQTSVAQGTFPANTDFTAHMRFLNSYGHPYDQEIEDLYETPVFESHHKISGLELPGSVQSNSDRNHKFS